MDDAVVVSTRGAVMVITINRPESRNAINRAVSEGVCAAVDELDASDTLRVGVLTGAGGYFCSGMDLKAFIAGERPAISGRGICGITQTPPRKPLIAAVEGPALAGGFELVLACDLVVAGESARFGLPEVKRGLLAATGALVLGTRVPTAIALEMLLVGDPVSAERAVALGLVNRATPDGQAVETAVEIANQIAANGPFAVETAKRVVQESADWPADERWSRQAEIVKGILASEDAREGATAFVERRAPVWTGR